MTNNLLLDTCAAIWMSEGAMMSQESVGAIDRAYAQGRSVYLSPITAWERGILSSRGRLMSPISPHVWFAKLSEIDGMAVTELTADILIDSSFLPGDLHNDPADRIIIATARSLDLAIVTRDRRILDYATQGHVRALAC